MVKYLLATVIGLLSVAYIKAGPIPVEFKELAPTIRTECLKQSDVAVELLDRASNGDFADDQKLKCYLKCTFDHLRILNETGVNFDAVLKIAPPSLQDIAKKIVADCSDLKPEKEGDMCDLVYQVNKCMSKTAGDKFFVIH